MRAITAVMRIAGNEFARVPEMLATIIGALSISRSCGQPRATHEIPEALLLYAGPLSVGKGAERTYLGLVSATGLADRYRAAPITPLGPHPVPPATIQSASEPGAFSRRTRARSAKAGSAT